MPSSDANHPQPSPTSAPVSFQEVLAFNRQLLRLSEAGLPVCLVPGRYGQALRADLESIENVVARRLGTGAPLDEPAGEGPPVPPRYVAALESWRAGYPAELALEPLVREPVEDADRYQAWMTVGMQALVLAALAYGAFLLLSRRTFPAMVNLMESAELDPREQLTWLWPVYGAVDWWSLLIPAVAALAVAAWWWRRSRGMRGSSIRRLERLFGLGGSPAESTSTRHDPAWPELAAMRVGLGEPSSLAIVRAARACDVPFERRPAEQLPPLLRWAIAGDPSSEQQVGRLRAVAHAYRQMNRSRQRFGRMIPLVAGFTVSGLIVLLSGAGLFSPYLRMLQSLAGIH